MANDLFAEVKHPKTGKATGEFYVFENPPVEFVAGITELCAVMRNWPKRCVILGTEGAQCRS
eukprot:13502765-Alexandrium_andersonii.AAC.1